MEGMAMVEIGNARCLPRGWRLLSGSGARGESDDLDTGATAGEPVAARADAPLTATLPTVRLEALVAALLFGTPLHPLGYVMAVVGLARSRRIARADGWPLVPGLPLLLCGYALACGHDAITLWARMHAG